MKVSKKNKKKAHDSDFTDLKEIYFKCVYQKQVMFVQSGRWNARFLPEIGSAELSLC